MNGWDYFWTGWAASLGVNAMLHGDAVVAAISTATISAIVFFARRRTTR